MFILDTDVLSNLRKAKSHPSARAWIERSAWQELSTTVITIAEIQCGIERQRPLDQAYAHQTQAWLDGLLTIGQPHVIPLGVAAALLLARMHEAPGLRNFVVPSPGQKRPKTAGDLAIAAIAIAEGAVIASGNQRHYEEIDTHFAPPGLYNPFTDVWSKRPAALPASDRP